MTRPLHYAFRGLMILALLAPAVVADAQRGGSSREEHVEELALAVGDTKTISAAGVRNFADPVGGIIDVKTTGDGTQFVISARKTGTTTLLLIKNDGSNHTYVVSVWPRNPAAVERDLTALVDGIAGVRVRRVGGRFFLDGGVSTEAEKKRLDEVAAKFQGQVESLVTVGGNLPDKRVLLRLDFFFVQYERTSSYAVGLGWPSSIGGAGVVQSRLDFDLIANTTTTAQASVVNQPLPKLDIGSKYGWAKVLKQSTVITSNGVEATFNSGGEQNFVSTSGLQGAQIVRLQFGTNVTVLPRFEAVTKEVEIKLDADVSDLVPSISAASLPGRTTTHLNTLVNLKIGQALVLSGIRTRTERKESEGLPGLAAIPIIGVLFGSQRKASEDVEGAVFIIPSVIETVPKSALEVIKNALGTYEDFSGNMGSVDSYSKSPPSAK
ncbi:MAG: hypothetical protein IPG50_06940 [Myxococcales bacterium]|nr:hypothetical protein [Myxococcales bacterium]